MAGSRRDEVVAIFGQTRVEVTRWHPDPLDLERLCGGRLSPADWFPPVSQFDVYLLGEAPHAAPEMREGAEIECNAAERASWTAAAREYLDAVAAALRHLAEAHDLRGVAIDLSTGQVRAGLHRSLRWWWAGQSFGFKRRSRAASQSRIAQWQFVAEITQARSTYQPVCDEIDARLSQATDPPAEQVSIDTTQATAGITKEITQICGGRLVPISPRLLEQPCPLRPSYFTVQEAREAEPGPAVVERITGTGRELASWSEQADRYWRAVAAACEELAWAHQVDLTVGNQGWSWSGADSRQRRLWGRQRRLQEQRRGQWPGQWQGPWREQWRWSPSPEESMAAQGLFWVRLGLASLVYQNVRDEIIRRQETVAAQRREEEEQRRARQRAAARERRQRQRRVDRAVRQTAQAPLWRYAVDTEHQRIHIHRDDIPMAAALPESYGDPQPSPGQEALDVRALDQHLRALFRGDTPGYRVFWDRSAQAAVVRDCAELGATVDFDKWLAKVSGLRWVPNSPPKRRRTGRPAVAAASEPATGTTDHDLAPQAASPADLDSGFTAGDVGGGSARSDTGGGYTVGDTGSGYPAGDTGGGHGAGSGAGDSGGSSAGSSAGDSGGGYSGGGYSGGHSSSHGGGFGGSF